MSFDTVIIGKGDTGVTTIKVFQPKELENISENSRVYRIHNVLGSMGMTVFRDTKEGKKIEKLIESNAPLYKIDEYCLKEFVKRVRPEQLIDTIMNIQSEAFEEGKRAKENEIKSVLNIREW